MHDDLPSQGVQLGASGAHFRVWAPHARSLTLRLDGRDYRMIRSEAGIFSLTNAEATAGSRYCYVFDDGRERPDPASRRQPEGVHSPSQIFDPGSYPWSDRAWRGLPLESLVFYELHVGTFTAEGTLDAAARRLDDLAELGITCVELMPVQPFAGSRNWGYDGVLPYAVHEAYGGPEALQRFVDVAHRRGLAVCLDVVYNHFGPEGNYLRDFGPYFSSRHRSPWGDGINYDGPGSQEVRRFAIGAALQWVRDFHLDALRLDAIHA
ncbi:MAG TPA: alpha-amylase family glycosyl hydrolase, partial [Myxococcaceae bacterium]|nr:alpha-amylase family glycosyl hydrolase [Myxococcaceae bacterium]